ncbi:MAG: hypothetical protein ABIS84_11645 [Arachnia sp.]
MGINPSVREILTRSGAEWAGTQRRFETLSSLGIGSMTGASDETVERVVQRCLTYFMANPYRSWFDPLEPLVDDLFGASYDDGSACHLDIVQWPTQPLWGQLASTTRTELTTSGLALLREQFSGDALQCAYLNGRTVCEAVGTFVPLSARTARFKDRGPVRGFFHGTYEGVHVVGCSSNLQVERLRAGERSEFRTWIVDECRRDLALTAPRRPVS